MPETIVEPELVDQRYKNEGEVLLALRDHYAGGHYCLLPQVRNDAAFNSNRTADALVVGTWPSRGLDLTGVEIKVSRADWLKEYKDPKKADDIGKYCDFWVVAAGDDKIVKPEELPTAWGLLVPGKKPNTMRMKVPPTRNSEPKPISRGFLVSILSRCVAVATPFAEIDKEINRRVAEQVAEREKHIEKRLLRECDPHSLKASNQKFTDAAEAFYRATGCYLSADRVDDYARLGAAYKILQYSGLSKWLEQAENRLAGTITDIHALRESLPKELAG